MLCYRVSTHPVSLAIIKCFIHHLYKFKRTKKNQLVKTSSVKFMNFMPVLIQKLNINKEIGDHNSKDLTTYLN
uniref:Uncharacterized protein n=1 Tax=Populus trichocarpa TaxID=3694 RepID=A0A2K2ANB8_POPTR